jgi:hypothetical protein
MHIKNRNLPSCQTKNYKKGSVKSKVHKVLMLGDGHARGCASEVKQLLNNEYEDQE